MGKERDISPVSSLVKTFVYLSLVCLTELRSRKQPPPTIQIHLSVLIGITAC